MKIIVNGYLIDTETIYNLSNVQSHYNHTHVGKNKDKCTFLGDTIIISHTFIIYFLNKKHISITLHDVYNNIKSGDVEFKWYEDKRIEQYDKVEKLRKEVEVVWLNNQTTIPRFDF